MKDQCYVDLCICGSLITSSSVVIETNNEILCKPCSRRYFISERFLNTLLGRTNKPYVLTA